MPVLLAQEGRADGQFTASLSGFGTPGRWLAIVPIIGRCIGVTNISDFNLRP